VSILGSGLAANSHQALRNHVSDKPLLSSRRPPHLYSTSCREGVFSETGLPLNSILGNSGHKKSQGF
jgi:hypothetical protein